MNDQEILDRFEELEAGRIFGDLDASEVKEWEELSQNSLCQPDVSLELTAGALEASFCDDDDWEMPAELIAGLKDGMSGFISTPSAEDTIVRFPVLRRIFSDPGTAWVVAAVFALLFVMQSMVGKNPISSEPTVARTTKLATPKDDRDGFISNAPDLVESKFGGVGDYEGMSGSVVWSDELQEGYMSLANLPANDPSTKQYQLWIVDPARDEKPVDGGVFDISTIDGTAVIPIRNPLVVANPQAFVITLEQPGGVVVSKQEVVVALAKTS